MPDFNDFHAFKSISGGGGAGGGSGRLTWIYVGSSIPWIIGKLSRQRLHFSRR